MVLPERIVDVLLGTLDPARSHVAARPEEGYTAPTDDLHDRAIPMALKLLVDTSVWLDLAKDYRQQPVIAALEDLVGVGEIELLVPQVRLPGRSLLG
jgi:hypothetical protein